MPIADGAEWPSCASAWLRNRRRLSTSRSSVAKKLTVCRRACVLIAAALVALPTTTSAQTFSGRVVGISDGDTVTVMRDGQAVRIRLDGIDAPESGQDFTNSAKQLLSDLVFDERVTVNVKDTDRYGRLVSRVLLNGSDTSLALVEAGLAWHYVQYSDDPIFGLAPVSWTGTDLGFKHSAAATVSSRS